MAAPKEIEDLVERFEQKREQREYKKKAKAGGPGPAPTGRACTSDH